MQKFTSFYYAATTSTADNNWPTIKTSIADQNLGVDADRNTARGPNLGCGSPITPLTASKATIEAALAAMGPVPPRRHHRQPRADLGLAHDLAALARPLGRRDADLPLDYAPDFMEKVVVMLTDGNNQFHDQDTSTSNNSVPASDFTAYGRIETLIGASTGNAAHGGARAGDPRRPHDRDLHGDEGGGHPDLHDHLRRRAGRDGAGPLRATARRRRRCTTTRRRTRRSATAFRAIGGQLANLRIVE